MKQTTYICDIKNCATEATHINEKMQVIFKTNQTDGSNSPSHFTFVTMDICDGCFDKLLGGTYIVAYGAQGQNTYYIKEK